MGTAASNRNQQPASGSGGVRIVRGVKPAIAPKASGKTASNRITVLDQHLSRITAETIAEYSGSGFLNREEVRFLLAAMDRGFGEHQRRFHIRPGDQYDLDFAVTFPNSDSRAVDFKMTASWWKGKLDVVDFQVFP